ncbi:hypothetical protein CRUP_002926 [Coryphaenoides rupestris]|nr:hypothetical protein CRUP_002926 [Coryphaenoides rupestris]
MALESRITQEEVKKEPEKPVDREKFPCLVRTASLFSGRHHRGDEFARGNVPSSELQIYTCGRHHRGDEFAAATFPPASCRSTPWMDATLKELTSLVKEVYPDARKKGTHFSFATVYPDQQRPGYRVKDLGSTVSGRKGTDDAMTLQSQRFQIGDYMDVAITPPNRPPPMNPRMRPF